MSVMDQNEPDLTILYGSQTGNAEDMSKRIGLQARSRGFIRVKVLAMDDFPLKLLPKTKLAMFVCSTTGHGQEPENMKYFFNFIRRRDIPQNCLNGLRLKECGAEPLQELVASDEQHPFGCDGLIYPKLEELWISLRALSIGHPVVDKSLLELDSSLNKRNTYTVTFYSDSCDKLPSTSDVFSSDFKTKYNILKACCTVNRRLTPSTHFQDTRLLCFKIDDDTIDYEPGDVCSIFPQNSEHSIEDFLNILNLDAEQRFGVRKIDSENMVNYLYDFIPDGLKIRDLVRYYLDIQSVPKRSFFEYLWPFSDDSMERDKLKEFASTEGQAELYEYCIRTKRTILETMLDFPKTIKNIKFEYLFDLIPPIKPRSFSIASALDKHPNEIELLVGVVEYKTSMKKKRLGLCSNYLANMTAVGQHDSSLLRFFIRKTSFSLPSDAKVPIIMIGPGLGLSPFRSFIEQRSMYWMGDEAQAVAPSYFYFGCRYRDKDFYLQDELEAYARNKIISLRVAFSRERASKQYVQDLMRVDAELIRRLIRQEAAVVYVAGNSKLPEAVRSLLGELLFESAGESAPDEKQREQLVANLEASNRIQYDCW